MPNEETAVGKLDQCSQHRKAAVAQLADQVSVEAPGVWAERLSDEAGRRWRALPGAAGRCRALPGR